MLDSRYTEDDVVSIASSSAEWTDLPSITELPDTAASEFNSPEVHGFVLVNIDVIQNKVNANPTSQLKDFHSNGMVGTVSKESVFETWPSDNIYSGELLDKAFGGAKTVINEMIGTHGTDNTQLVDINSKSPHEYGPTTSKNSNAGFHPGEFHDHQNHPKAFKREKGPGLHTTAAKVELGIYYREHKDEHSNMGAAYRALIRAREKAKRNARDDILVEVMELGKRQKRP